MGRWCCMYISEDAVDAPAEAGEEAEILLSAEEQASLEA